MMQFAESYSDSDIVLPLARQLSWSHFLVLQLVDEVRAELYSDGPEAETNKDLFDLLYRNKARIDATVNCDLHTVVAFDQLRSRPAL